MPERKLITVEEINAAKPIFSKLKVIKILPDVGYVRWIRCICECGNKTNLRFHSFISGRTISCGCYWSEITREASRKYIGSNKYIYSCYKGMIDRCYNNNSKSFKNYGAVGIKVCDDWINNCQVFLDWALANGWEKGLQLDKDIKYLEKFPTEKRGMLYSPEYCQFVTCKENRKKTSRSVYVKYKGDKISVIDFCKTHNIDRDTLSYRMKIGYTIEEAVRLKKHTHKK